MISLLDFGTIPAILATILLPDELPSVARMIGGGECGTDHPRFPRQKSIQTQPEVVIWIGTQEEIMFSRLFVVLATMMLLCSTGNGQQSARNQAKEQVIVEELANIAPKAVETFKRATDAMDKQDYKQAVQLYREVILQAPTFTPALRRLGGSLAASGQSDEGLVLLETALQYQRSPENLASLAQVLANPSPGKEGTPDQMSKALGLATEARRKYTATDDSSYALLLAHLAMVLQRDAEFREATSDLVKNYPELMPTHYYNAVLSAMDGSWIRAEDEIKRAGQMGLPSQAAKDFLDSGVHTRAVAWHWAYYSLYLVAAWACGLFFLFLTGKPDRMVHSPAS